MQSSESSGRDGGLGEVPALVLDLLEIGGSERFAAIVVDPEASFRRVQARAYWRRLDHLAHGQLREAALCLSAYLWAANQEQRYEDDRLGRTPSVAINPAV